MPKWTVTSATKCVHSVGGEPSKGTSWSGSAKGRIVAFSLLAMSREMMAVGCDPLSKRMVAGLKRTVA